MKRNWKVIAAIKCERTKLALATCKTAELARLQMAFPECFEEGDETVFATWSEVIAKSIASNDSPRAAQFAPLMWGSEYHKQFGGSEIPGALQFATPAHNDHQPVPQELIDQIAKMESLNGPVIVQYQGREWIVADIYNALLPDIIVDGDPGSLYAKTFQARREIYLEIVPKELIALDL